MKKFLQKQKIVSFVAIIVFFLLSILLSTTAISKAGQTHTEYGNDFTVFYAAARNLYYYGDPYNHPIAAKTPYLYLPLFSLLIMPLGAMQLKTAASIWYWLNISFTLSSL
jgi:alpha-1,2-mannosyltransferase